MSDLPTEDQIHTELAAITREWNRRTDGDFGYLVQRFTNVSAGKNWAVSPLGSRVIGEELTAYAAALDEVNRRMPLIR